jgi:hypothetical protein
MADKTDPADEPVPATFYTRPPVGVSAWHRHYVRGQIAGTTSVDCTGCAAPCCTGFDFITLDPDVDDLTQYETRPLEDGGVGLQQRADGACIYFVEGRCSIHPRRPAICRHFDCRIYHMVPPDEVLDDLEWSGAARDAAVRLRDTAIARFPLEAKEPDDETFYERFMDRFSAFLAQHPGCDMATALQGTLMQMTDARAYRRYVDARRAEIRRR